MSYFIDFVKTNSADPLREFELTVGNLPTGIYWPTGKAHAFSISNPKRQNGLDVEVEEIKAVTDTLCATFEPLKFDYGRTRLEVAAALSQAVQTARRSL